MSDDLDFFLSSYEILLKSAQKMTNIILTDPGDLVNFCRVIKELSAGGTIHITGMGRSGKVGIIFGNMLKNLGYKVSIIGKTLAKPVLPGDVVIGFSGSGWTRTTTQNVADSIRQEAYVLSFTGNPKSLLARMSDHRIIIPEGFDSSEDSITSYRIRKIAGEISSPLTPMGTVFELTTLFITFGIIGALQSDSYIQGFTESTTEILTDAQKTIEDFGEKPSKILEMIEMLSTCQNCDEDKEDGPVVFVAGSGVNNIISSMSSMRLQHLGLRSKSPHDWRFRRENDIIIGISGSGETTSILGYFKDAKDAKMRIGTISGFKNSSVMKNADIGLAIEGRHRHEPISAKPINEMPKKFRASFEFITAITLDAFVAQLARNFNISEVSMKVRHANVE